MTSDDSDNTDSRPAPLGVMILAAGRGTRMKSRRPKVLHEILGRSMLDHVIDAVSRLNPDGIVVVSDPASSQQLRCTRDVLIAVQQVPFGTADAAAVGMEALSLESGTVLVLNGDVPLIQPASLQAMIAQHDSNGKKLTLATFPAAGASKYGRVRRRAGRITAIVEAADDDSLNGERIEANGGVYAFDAAWLREHVGKVPVSASGEYYITSLVGMLARISRDDDLIGAVGLDETELLGVDDRLRLAEAEAVMRNRVLQRHMACGVTIVDPDRTVIEPGVVIEPDVRIEPGCFLRGQSVIRTGAVVGPYSVIEDSTIGVDATVLQSWVLGSDVGERTQVGPFSRLRPGSSIGPDVKLGNFVETKAASIGPHSHVHHFSYLGDATLGSNVNIGAGTITCNYDGVAKHRTVIGNDVFVGSDTMLVAPVELGDGSSTGAGAVVTRSVPPGKTVVGIPARPIDRDPKGNTQGEHGR